MAWGQLNNHSYSLMPSKTMKVSDLDTRVDDRRQSYANWGTATVEKTGRAYIGQHSRWYNSDLIDLTRMRGWPTKWGAQINGTTHGVGLTEEEARKMAEEQGQSLEDLT